MNRNTTMRVRRLEQQLERQQEALEALGGLSSRSSTDDTAELVGRCAQCSDGWVVKENACLVCRGCSYVGYL